MAQLRVGAFADMRTESAATADYCRRERRERRENSVEREGSVTPVFAIKTAALREKAGGFGGKEDSDFGDGRGKSQRLNERLEGGTNGAVPFLDRERAWNFKEFGYQVSSDCSGIFL